MGEKHTNRTRPVRKIILRIMHSLMFNRTKVARVVQSPKQALITSSSSEPAGPLLSFLSDGWNNVFYQMVVSDPCHSYLDNRETTLYSSQALVCNLQNKITALSAVREIIEQIFFTILWIDSTSIGSLAGSWINVNYY